MFKKIILVGIFIINLLSLPFGVVMASEETSTVEKKLGLKRM